MMAGINEILIISTPYDLPDFKKLLGTGEQLGCKFFYEEQKIPNGLAQAFVIGEKFVGKDPVALILGDNIFERSFEQDIKSFLDEEGAKVFLKKVPDPFRFGVAEIIDGKIRSITEKPKKPKSDLVTTGFYLYDHDIFDKIKKLTPSARGEYEITDTHNMYIKEGKLSYSLVRGYWSDAGTFDSLLTTSEWAARILNNKKNVKNKSQ
jgi:glucose-1-phosphate thymidylyltransferase